MARRLNIFVLVSLAILFTTACNLTRWIEKSTPPPTQTKSVGENQPAPAKTTVPSSTPINVIPSLRNYAELRGIQFGTYIMAQAIADPAWQETAGREFDLANLFDGFSWAELEPEQGKFDFSIIDPQVEFALSQDMQVCGHTFLWPSYDGAYPQWVLDGHFTKSQLTDLLRTYLTTVIDHYRGKITCWIPVEEPYNPPDRDWDLLHATFGDYSYIDLVYQIAREEDPEALLIYNDCDNFAPDEVNTALTHEIVDRLNQKGLVDGVGLCMHLDAADPPDRQEVLETMKSYGMPVHVTEILVNLAEIPGTPEDRYALQAKIYADVLQACLDSGVCKSYSIWGFGDKYSYLERYYGNADATLFDDDLQPKPAYLALLEILKP